MENIAFPQFSKDQLQIFDNLPSGVLILTDNGQSSLEYKYSNPFLAQSLDYTHEEFAALLTENCFAAIYEADKEKARSSRADVMSGKIVDSVSRQKKKDGSYVWILAHIRQISVDGKQGLFFLFSRIQELIGLQNELHEKNEAWSDILNSVPVGLLVFKIENGITTTLSVNQALVEFANTAGNLIDANKRAWTAAEFAMIINQDIFAFSEEEYIPDLQKMLKDSETAPMTKSLFRLRGSGSTSPIFVSALCASKETGDNCRTYYVVYQNVTESENRRMELLDKQTQLYELSYHDALTGIKSRNAYNEYVKYCKQNRIYDVGIAFCDLNGLKQMNDTFGHAYGDKMILRFVDLLKEFFNPNYIYRLSGDEFLIIYPDVEHEVFQNTMGELIARIREEDNLASIGYIWKANVSDIQRRTTQAEKIMYVEKQRYYEAHRTVSSKHRSHFLEALLTDFEQGRFVVYLQPKTAMDESKIIGAEALVRKIGEDGRIISPYEFIPMLEHEKLIPKLDFFMLEETCAFLEEQHRAGHDDFSVSVNISRVTIVENEFIDTVASIMEKYEFQHSNLELELTESNETMDSMRLEEYMLQLKKLGVKISLDDMGTDYSTLTLLLMEGIDWVKLDRSLIIRLEQPKTKTLLKHIIHMCHDLKLKVIAEGVETHEDRQLLLDMGCDAYQGYLKSKPIPIQEFKEKFL